MAIALISIKPFNIQALFVYKMQSFLLEFWNCNTVYKKLCFLYHMIGFTLNYHFTIF